MRVKTSITLSDDLLRDVDRAAGSTNRSRFIEEALRDHLARRARAARDRRELLILNRAAAAPDREMADVLEYQEEP
jgi:metal-responsive CopG/Arc/MetJ family transcriptional regulator